MKQNRKINVAPRRQGLYDPDNERDACGVGLVVNIKGNKTHDIVENGLQVLEHMMHRGAEGADNKTGDGAGILVQIPHEFILLQGIPKRGITEPDSFSYRATKPVRRRLWGSSNETYRPRDLT